MTETYRLPVTYYIRQENNDGTFYAWLRSDPDTPVDRQKVLYGPWHLRDTRGNMIAGVVKTVRQFAKNPKAFDVKVLGGQPMVDELGDFGQTFILHVGMLD